MSTEIIGSDKWVPLMPAVLFNYKLINIGVFFPRKKKNTEQTKTKAKPVKTSHVTIILNCVIMKPCGKPPACMCLV